MSLGIPLDTLPTMSMGLKERNQLFSLVIRCSPGAAVDYLKERQSKCSPPFNDWRNSPITPKFAVRTNTRNRTFDLPNVLNRATQI